MDTFIALLIFIGILLLVVLIHEAGHFFAARWMGVKVEEFGFGFPPKLFGWKPKDGETEYTFNVLPLGGFVKLYGEDGSHADDPRSFAAKPYRAKAFIITAGVLMNLILAVIVFWIMGLIGAPTVVPEDESQEGVSDVRVRVVQVVDNSPAQEAGLNRLDEITSVNGTSVTSVDQLQQLVDESRGEEVTLTITRGNETREINLMPRTDPPKGEGELGVALQKIGLKQLGVLESAKQAVSRVENIIVGTVVVLYQLIEGVFVDQQQQTAAEVSGPVGIFSVVQQMYQQGFAYVLSIIGVLSTSLAFFNILPIPALDGGRLAFLTVERIRGKALPTELVEQIHGAGLLILLALIIGVTIKDIIDLL